jgi:hypothetical protein
MSRTHEHWPLTTLLKDADALDRVRLGDLDARYLRHREAHGMICFAQEVFDLTDGVIEVGDDHFRQLWETVQGL